MERSPRMDPTHAYGNWWDPVGQWLRWFSPIPSHQPRYRWYPDRTDYPTTSALSTDTLSNLLWMLVTVWSIEKDSPTPPHWNPSSSTSAHELCSFPIASLNHRSNPSSLAFNLWSWPLFLGLSHPLLCQPSTTEYLIVQSLIECLHRFLTSAPWNERIFPTDSSGTLVYVSEATIPSPPPPFSFVPTLISLYVSSSRSTLFLSSANMIEFPYSISWLGFDILSITSSILRISSWLPWHTEMLNVSWNLWNLPCT